MKDRSVYSGVRVHRKAVGEASLNCWATSSRKGRTNEKAHRYKEEERDAGQLAGVWQMLRKILM